MSFGVADAIWSASFMCSGGYLEDGTEAKLPLGFSMPDFTEPKVFAVRVACMLKHFGVQTLLLMKALQVVLTLNANAV